MQVADQPAPLDVAHDVLDRRERALGRGLVVHREEDARDELHHEHDDREYPEGVPDVEVLRRVILGGVLLDELRHRETLVDPRAERAEPAPEPIEHVCFGARHQVLPVSDPINMVLSLMNRYGGTSRLSGAGTPWNTRPARSNFEP